MPAAATLARPDTTDTAQPHEDGFGPVIAAIIAETGTTPEIAGGLARLIANEDEWDLDYFGGQVVHLSAEDIARYHGVYVIIMPDDRVTAPPGSAQELLNLLVDPDGKRVLVHRSYAPAGIKPSYCTVALELTEPAA